MTASRLLLLHAETPLHPGSGSALGAVDLPVARERHTQWPLIPGSSLKGVLRDRCLRESGSEQAFIVFGPDTEKAGEFAGALSLTDARLLAFPVRSLRGLFAWTTCPGSLLRLQRDLKIGGSAELAKAIDALVAKMPAHGADKKALVSSGALTTGVSKGDTTNMVLEEFDFIAEESVEVKALGELIDKLLGQGTRLGTHLAVISDNAFGHYTRFATEVMARIGIDSATKTVKDGALFYEEFLPAGSIFYALALAADSYKKDAGELAKADAILGFLEKHLKPSPTIIQVGANATTGKGLCHAVLAGGN